MKTITNENIMKEIRVAVVGILAQHGIVNSHEQSQAVHVQVSVDDSLPQYEDSTDYLLKLLVHLEPIEHARTMRLINNYNLTPSMLSKMNLPEVNELRGAGFRTLIQLMGILERAGINCPWIFQFRSRPRYRREFRFSRY